MNEVDYASIEYSKAGVNNRLQTNPPIAPVDNENTAPVQTSDYTKGGPSNYSRMNRYANEAGETRPVAATVSNSDKVDWNAYTLEQIIDVLVPAGNWVSADRDDLFEAAWALRKRISDHNDIYDILRVVCRMVVSEEYFEHDAPLEAAPDTENHDG